MASLNLETIVDDVAGLVADKVVAKLQDEERSVKPRLLTAAQAAVYLGRSEEAVRHMISSGKLPVVRQDRRVLLDIQDLDAWIEDNKQVLVM